MNNNIDDITNKFLDKFIELERYISEILLYHEIY